MASKFYLLERIPSFSQFVADTAVTGRRKPFDEHPGYDAPAVATRMDEAPGGLTAGGLVAGHRARCPRSLPEGHCDRSSGDFQASVRARRRLAALMK
jgi:hypothetical protein